MKADPTEEQPPSNDISNIKQAAILKSRSSTALPKITQNWSAQGFWPQDKDNSVDKHNVPTTQNDSNGSPAQTVGQDKVRAEASGAAASATIQSAALTDLAQPGTSLPTIGRSSDIKVSSSPTDAARDTKVRAFTPASSWSHIDLLCRG